MQPEPPTRLTIVRHGETAANLEGVWHGSIDTELTDRGARQALRVAAALAASAPAATALYSSPLRRARETARAIADALALEPRLEPDLAEYHLGALEGRSYQELFAEHRLFERMREDPDWRPGGGESPRQVAERCAGALGRIAAAHPGERVIVVSHGGALTLGLGLLLDGDPATWRRVMDNCAITELSVASAPALLAFNRVDHLDGI
jgi:2,3-bisphosphoglycerate-dependent phosphoglycerate mutase